MNTTAKQIVATKNAPKLPNDGSIPDFLKRTETPAQEEARRAKLAPKNDSKGLKVITPPDPKIMAAVAKDFVEKGQKAQAVVDAVLTKPAERAAASALDKINAERAKDGLRPYMPNKGKSDGARARRARDKEQTKAPKKSGSLVDKALKARDDLTAKAKAAPAAKQSAQKTAAQKAVSTHTSTKPSKKKSNVHRYAWSEAEEKAAKGIMPAAPDMSAWTHRYFRASLAEVVAMAKAKNLKALESMKFTRNTGSPGMVNRYRKIAMAALRAAKK